MAPPATPPSVEFDTTLSAQGNNTGIVIPPDAIERLGAGNRPPVSVDVNGYAYRSTVAVMGGQHMIGVSTAIRKETGLVAGDSIHVTLTLATTPRGVVVPDDLAAALAEHPEAQAFFGTLSNSLQRFHVDNVNGAKAPETRARRVAKAIDLFLTGKAR